MSDPTALTADPLPPPGEFDTGLDAALFPEHESQNDIVHLEDLDFDFSFDDVTGDLDELLNSTQVQQNCSPQIVHDPNLPQFGPNFDQFDRVFKSSSLELRHDAQLSGDRSWDGGGSGLLTSDESHQISGYLNVSSPESNGSTREENCGVVVADGKGLSCPSPESRGSGNCGSNVSEDENNCSAVRSSRSASSSPDSRNSSVRSGVVVDQKVKLEESADKGDSLSKIVLKRKKEGEDVVGNSKYRKSNGSIEDNDSSGDNNNVGGSSEEEKRKARLMRNRESAQLSRQRKKHYVEELEDKVRTMHSTIQDLNAKISYFMTENATMRQQMGGAGAVPPPAMAPPPPGMYPHPAMMYPWMPCPPPYMMKPQGSQVPLVPIPRLKPQQPAQAPKTNKKVESKKSEGPKTKKVAGISFLGLLFFMMLFGGLVPMVNVKYGGVREAFTGKESYFGGGIYDKHHGRVLMVNGTEYGGRKDHSGNNSVHFGHRGHGSGAEPSADEFVRMGNESEPLVASLYVPRNDKLVKIDGNLIIHSVLASEKAMASNEKGGGETGLAVPGDLAPAIPVGRNGARYHPQLRALASGSADKDNNLKSTAADGKLQQWFREGLAGPMLRAGMCTEVFQFDVSAASSGAIIQATTTRNITEDKNQTSTHPSKGKNRRILHGLPIPLPESARNISKKHSGNSSQKEDLGGDNNFPSSMVVSVLFDPREAGDADVDGVMGTKSLTRIFVVVLIDSVKYVTYSCMLPFKGSAPHLVTT